jgi:hypothetical protein
MIERQLELGLANGRMSRSVNLRGRRHRRRHEWFERMRQVVDSAPDREAQESETPLRFSALNTER